MVAILFFSSRFMPSLKKVVEGRICTIYSFSASVAGRKSSIFTCMLKGLFLILISSPPYSRVILGSTTLYRISLTRFIITIRVARTMVVPMIRV